MKRPTPVKCSNCRFWAGTYDEGECRRRAPAPVRDKANTHPRAAFLLTRSYHWCGEHEPSVDGAPK